MSTETPPTEVVAGEKSYTSGRMGLIARINEFIAVYRFEAIGAAKNVAGIIREMREVEQELDERLGFKLGGKRALEIGSGPNSVHLAYIALNNDAVGIDTNIVPATTDIRGWIQMTRHNGPMRTFKTITRRLLGVDRKRRRAFCDAMGVSAWPKAQMLEMSAQDLKFPDASFDFVYSHAVFEHLPDPAKALAEVKRVLRPGGAAVLIFHLYTSDSGCHDARIFAGAREDLPYWSHLRKQHQHLVQSNAYLNELTLAEWQEAFEATLPDSTVFTVEENNAELRAQLAQVRAAGELPDYTDEELMCPTVWGVWGKPAA